MDVIRDWRLNGFCQNIKEVPEENLRSLRFLDVEMTNIIKKKKGEQSLKHDFEILKILLLVDKYLP